MNLRRLLLTTTAAVVTAGIPLVAALPAAAAASATVHTDAVNLTVRAAATSNSAALGTIADGTVVSISCQTHGETITGKYGTSDVWDYLPGRGGYITDTYVYTGSDGLVAPLCTSGGATCNSSLQATSCAAAVAWAKARIGDHDTSAYGGLCDHTVGLAYGHDHSGSTTAYNHWLAIPASYKHAGDRSVPAGGLAFFRGGSSGAGHVMISIGGGDFVSNDIVTYGTLSRTTIGTVESKWGETYLGWAQPWFQINH